MTAQAGGASPLFSPDVNRAERERVRREMRARRRALSAEQREHAARQVARIARRAGLLKAGAHAAIYLAHGCEIDLGPLIDAARRCGVILYAPVVTHYRAKRMSFARFDADARLRPNRYGILEPVVRRYVSAARLDLVFAPLIAFDERGARLGTGAGFYDRALRRLRAGRRWRRPHIVGVAYSFQRTSGLEPAPWDVPLDAVLTEQGYLKTTSLREPP